MKVIMFSLLFTTLLVSFVWTKDLEKIYFQDIVEEINSDPKSTWKADDYGISEMSMEAVRDRLGAILRNHDVSSESKSKNGKNFLLGSKSRRVASPEDKLGSSFFLPTSYDARQRYPDCDSISHIRDQSACGSCWAVSAASAFSDRICIHSNGKYNFELSSRYIMSCDKKNYGCEGGYLDIVWDFLKKNGTVTGGEYLSDSGCQPYPLYPCAYPKKYPCPSSYGFITPKCLQTKCDNEFYPFEKEKRIFKVQESYQVGNWLLPIFNEYLIRKEIYENGPVQVGFQVYADFLSYKSGIYIHSKRMKMLGGHAVKLIGWGEEKGIKYWIAANSWGEEWGEKGTFRIIRGINNCGIEEEVYAGIP